MYGCRWRSPVLTQRHRRRARCGVHRSGRRVTDDQRSLRFGGHLAIVERPLLVLGLGPAEGCLQGHHALSLRRQAALLAVAVAVLAVPFMTLEGDLEAVVATASTVRRSSRIQLALDGARRTVHLRPGVVARVGHGLHPAVLRNHQTQRTSRNNREDSPHLATR